MSADIARRFSNLEVLQGIGRNLLNQFLAQFQSDLAANNTPAPDPDLPEDAFFAAAVSLFSTLHAQPLHAPPRLIEALTSITEMSKPGQAEKTCQQLSRIGVEIAFDPGTTPEHKATILWFATPLVLARLQNYQDVTLQSLRTEGPDTLKPNDVASLSRVALQKIKVKGDSATNEVLTREADDLFASPEPADDLIPPGKIISASIALYFNGAMAPHKVKLTSAGRIKLSNPADAIPVACWLSTTRFLLAKTPVSTALCHLLLALCNLLDLPLLPDLFCLATES